MLREPIITKEIAQLPSRSDHAHKGDVGRILVVGGCVDAQSAMIGAVGLTANAAFRGGAGLVQCAVPAELRTAIATLSPCSTFRTLPKTSEELAAIVQEFNADVIAFGPGLGKSLEPKETINFLSQSTVPMVIDADGLNLIAGGPVFSFAHPGNVVLTPHLGEAQRLLRAKGADITIIDQASQSRLAAAGMLQELFKCNIVLKGRGTVVTNGERLYINQTGNSGMATAGAGDVLTGIIAALIGQGMECFEAAILGVYLHGLAGDFAAAELGRHALTALDLIDFLSEAFCDHGTSAEV